MAGNKVGLIDIIRTFYRLIAKAKMRNRNAACFFGVILEVCLNVFVGIVADDLDGVFVGANRTVTAKTPELTFYRTFSCGVGCGLFFKRKMRDVIVDTDGKLSLGSSLASSSYTAKMLEGGVSLEPKP